MTEPPQASPPLRGESLYAPADGLHLWTPQPPRMSRPEAPARTSGNRKKL
jgi:hypothetical protein